VFSSNHGFIIHNFLKKSFNHSTRQLAANLQNCASRFFNLLCYSQFAMSSTAQILANQHNAEHSTGPSSPAGKAASSRNATTHGLSSGFAVLPHEDRQEFERLLDSYGQTFTPLNEHETFLVERMVQSRWKLARLQRMEAALFQQMTSQEPNTDPDAVIVAAMLAGNASAYALLQRYTAAAERSYYKAKRELERERAASAKAEPLPVHLPVQVIRSVRNEPKPQPRPSARPAEYPPNPSAPLHDASKIASECAAVDRSKTKTEQAA